MFLVLREANLILRILFVPHLDQFFTGLADVFAVDNVATERTGGVQAVGKDRVGAEDDGEAACEVDAGREGPKPLHFDGAPGAAKQNDLIAGFLDGQIHSTLDEAGGAGDRADEFRLLDGVALFDTGTEGADGFYFLCHGEKISFVMYMIFTVLTDAVGLRGARTVPSVGLTLTAL